MSSRQKTLKQETTFHGNSLFTGKETVVRLIPAPPHTGIIFQRVDLPQAPSILATIENVYQTMRCTKLGSGDVSVQTIEHFMAAIHAYEIDNLIVQITGPELPIFDGSAKAYIQILDEAGVVEQDIIKDIFYLEKPFYLCENDTYLIALPHHEYRISYTLHYPSSPYLKSQYYSYILDLNTFRDEIAPCRTFILYQEVIPLIEAGLFKNANLDHGVIIDGEKVLNPEGVRFSDEMVRHKVLDIIGDFALLGCKFHAHLIAVKTGHNTNHLFAKELRKFLRKK